MKIPFRHEGQKERAPDKVLPPGSTGLRVCLFCPVATTLLMAAFTRRDYIGFIASCRRRFAGGRLPTIQVTLYWRQRMS